MKYFLHSTDSFNDEKIMELYMKFGYEGKGLFFSILERLALHEHPVKTDVLKAQLQVGKRLEKCWDFMESLGIISSSDGETFNKQLANYTGKYEIKKEKDRIRIANFRANHSKNSESSEPVTHYSDVTPVTGNAPKEEEKGKEEKLHTEPVGDFGILCTGTRVEKDLALESWKIHCSGVVEQFEDWWNNRMRRGWKDGAGQFVLSWKHDQKFYFEKLKEGAKQNGQNKNGYGKYVPPPVDEGYRFRLEDFFRDGFRGGIFTDDEAKRYAKEIFNGTRSLDKFLSECVEKNFFTSEVSQQIHEHIRTGLSKSIAA